ncbi:hypothetical protein VNO77_18254 [Canavalia gladiata]|uniref:Uncharacterized protein n=1 Tax=Canavalia gladiata TaxID=3824 RepID=A0AAN9QJG3_CANGL
MTYVKWVPNYSGANSFDRHVDVRFTISLSGGTCVGIILKGGPGSATWRLVYLRWTNDSSAHGRFFRFG